MLIITIPIQTHAVEAQHADRQPAAADDPAGGGHGGGGLDGYDSLERDIVADRPTLEAKFTSAAAQPIQPEFHLRPNKLVTYKHVAGVMASAQRLGITKIGLIGAEQFLD
jgi:biopolymer transport protein ExbD